MVSTGWFIYCRIGGQNSYLDFLSEIASAIVYNSRCINNTNESDAEVAHSNNKRVRAIDMPDQ